MSDVQINVAELMGAFARENAALTQRAVIAEIKLAATEKALNEVQSRPPVSDEEALRAAYDQGVEDGRNLQGAVAAEDSAVAAVKRAPAKKAAASRKARS